MRKTPSDKYLEQPCSFVSVGCAYEDKVGQSFVADLPDGLKSDGYLSLDEMNRFVRDQLPIRKKAYFARKERPTLRQFLEGNESCCVVCVLGHFLYVHGQDYWSFFDNDDDTVVCVWYLR